jgi:hypothetical protein
VDTWPLLGDVVRVQTLAGFRFTLTDFKYVHFDPCKIWAHLPTTPVVGTSLYVITFRCHEVREFLSTNEKVYPGFGTVKRNCVVWNRETCTTVAENLRNQPLCYYNVRTSVAVVLKRMADACDKTHCRCTSSEASVLYNLHSVGASSKFEPPSVIFSITSRCCVPLRVCRCGGHCDITLHS